MNLTALFLTYNEDLRISRCIENVSHVAKEVFVIDSFSKDKTVEIAKECGAKVLQHDYVNQTQNFQRTMDFAEKIRKQGKHQIITWNEV